MMPPVVIYEDGDCLLLSHYCLEYDLIILIPSLYRFWLFEPRCGFHDIGGWYVETYGKDKHGRTKPSQRFWDGLDYNMQADR